MQVSELCGSVTGAIRVVSESFPQRLTLRQLGRRQLAVRLLAGTHLESAQCNALHQVGAKTQAILTACTTVACRADQRRSSDRIYNQRIHATEESSYQPSSGPACKPAVTSCVAVSSSET